MAPRRDPLRGLYAALLRLYPRSFNDTYEGDLLQHFDDRRGEPRYSGVVGGLRLLLLLTADLAHSVPGVHRRFRRRGGGVMGEIRQDVRYAVRMVLKNPFFTTAVVLTLALGIGMNATVFSAVRGILLEPLPGVQAPDQLVQLYRSWGGLEFGSNSVPHYEDVRDRSDEVFESVAAWTFAPVALGTEGRTRRVISLLVSANFFETYGVSPVRGRPFLPDEGAAAPGAHAVVVLGHGFWQTRFGGDPGIVGRTVTLNGHPFEVVGVAPRDFRGPVRYADFPIYIPLSMAEQVAPCCSYLGNRGSNSFTVVARLRDGVGVARAQESMDGLLAQLQEEHPDHYATQVGTRIVPQRDAGLHPGFAGASFGLSSVMMAVVGILLLIACVNVANLFLARARDRRQEMALRLSLGAGRSRLVRQLLTESMLFAVIAGVAAVGLAALATWVLGAVTLPIDGPWGMEVEVDGAVLLFTGAVSLVAGIVFGMAPALQATRPDTMAAVKGEMGHPGRSRMSSALVVTQVALSLTLLIGSGLFLRSLQGATRIDPGFDQPRHVLTAAFDPTLLGYSSEETWALVDAMTDDVRALPGVEEVGVVSRLPLSLNTSDRVVGIPGYDFAEGERRNIQYSLASEGYLEALGVQVVEGRGFLRSDDGDGPPVIVVNRVFAERFWPEGAAVGKVVESVGMRRVVGVVENGKYNSLGEDPQPYMYLPARQLGAGPLTLVVRTPTAGQVLPRLRQVVNALDPNLPLYDVRTMEDHMGVALLPARLGGSALSLFGLLGMMLAAVGIYGVMAYSVMQRRREVGIRVALGAQRSQVTAMVLRQGLRLAVLGTALGLVGAVVLGRVVESLLYDVSALDPVAFTVVPALVLSVAALAVYLPARRAARVDPLVALRTE